MSPRSSCSWRRRLCWSMMLLLPAGMFGGLACADAFNPSFLQLFDGADAAFAGLDLPTGHIPMQFQNNARISDDVFRYVIRADTVVKDSVVDEIQRVNPAVPRETIEATVQAIIDGQPANLEDLNLPPRVRVTVNVTNVNGGVQQIEFQEGLRLVRTEDSFGSGAIPPELSQVSNDTFIVQCEIASIQIVVVEVFVPVVVRTTRTVFDGDGGVVGEECIMFTDPQFDDLNLDEGFDATTGTYTVRRNLDPRFFPPPLTSAQCGSVVILGLTGDLSLPFRDVPANCEPVINPPEDGRVPAYLNTDVQSALLIPGRYGVTFSVRESS